MTEVASISIPDPTRDSVANRAGRSIGVAVKVLLWGVLLSPALPVLPWGDAVGFAVLALELGALTAIKLSRPAAGTGASEDRPLLPAVVVLVGIAATTAFASQLGLPVTAAASGAVLVAASQVFGGGDRGLGLMLMMSAAFVAAGLVEAFTPIRLGGDVLWVSGEPYRDAQAASDFFRLAAACFLLGFEAVMRYEWRRSEQRVAEAEAQRDEAIASERTRIARELHDVVAHHVTVITVQADGARAALTTGMTEPVGDALDQIGRSGRTALTELRRLLGVLRASGAETDTLAPQPRLAAVEDLIDGAGLDVTLRVDGDRRPVADGIDLSAFRIVQEALTNARKHAGPDAHVEVRLAYGERDLVVEIVDDGSGRAATVPGGGNGLVGMEERVALIGGSLHAGPRPEGGYQVRAVLPVGDDAA